MVLKHRYYINRGLFIALYDEEEPLKIYLDNGVYGFIMSPAGSRHRNILADYACIRQRIKVFSFLKRKIICIGRIYGNKNSGSFLYERLYNSPKTDTTTDEPPRIKTYITAP